MKPHSSLTTARTIPHYCDGQPREHSPLARWILREIKLLGRAYRAGAGKALNPLIESCFPTLSRMFDGPGRFAGWFLVTMTLYLFLHSAEPAYALFLSAAQDYVNGLEFFAGSDQLVNIFFGILRAIVVIVLGYFVVRIALAVNRDEDWQTFVRYPVFIVGSIAIADFLTEFIVT